jgi:hypothetical protein
MKTSDYLNLVGTLIDVHASVRSAATPIEARREAFRLRKAFDAVRYAKLDRTNASAEDRAHAARTSAQMTLAKHSMQRVKLINGYEGFGPTGTRIENGHCSFCDFASFEYRNGTEWSADGVRGYRCNGCGTIKPEKEGNMFNRSNPCGPA